MRALANSLHQPSALQLLDVVTLDTTLYLRAEHYRGIQRICRGRIVLEPLLSCLA